MKRAPLHLLTLTVAVAALLTGCSTQTPVPPSPDHRAATQPASENFMCSVSAPQQSLVVFIPGLNQASTSFDAIRLALEQAEIASCVIPLRGLDPNRLPEDAHAASLEHWQLDLNEELNQLRERFPESSIHLFGYSIGAALAVEYVARNNSVGVEKLALVAPALALSRKASLARLVLPFRIFGISLPSFIPEQYRVTASTSLYSYNAAIDAVDAVAELDAATTLATHLTLLVACERDSIIGLKRIQAWLRRNELSSWRVELLCPEGSGRAVSSHLMIDEPSLGIENWERFQRTLVEFFR